MPKQKDENLVELFGKFIDEEQAQEMAAQIQQAEELLAANPSPQPEPRLIESIKNQIDSKLQHRERVKHIRAGVGVAVAAAVIVIVASLLIRSTAIQESEHTIADATIPTALWDSNSPDSDPELSVVLAQIKEIEDEIYASQRMTNGSEELNIEELEIEFMEINNDFWKG